MILLLLTSRIAKVVIFVPQKCSVVDVYQDPRYIHSSCIIAVKTFDKVLLLTILPSFFPFKR